MNNILVPVDFDVPEVYETDRLRLRILKVTDVIKDYDAVMTSIDHLQKTKPFWPEHKRPTKELTLEQDLIDLGWHQKEFQMKSSLAYTVMSLDENKCLWCMYIYPSTNSKYDAKIIMRVRESELSAGLDLHLFESVKKMISEKFPFKNPGYPWRDLNREARNNLK